MLRPPFVKPGVFRPAAPGFSFSVPFSRSISSGNREECVKEKGGVLSLSRGNDPR